MTKVRVFRAPMVEDWAKYPTRLSEFWPKITPEQFPSAANQKTTIYNTLTNNKIKSK